MTVSLSVVNARYNFCRTTYSDFSSIDAIRNSAEKDDNKLCSLSFKSLIWNNPYPTIMVIF